MRRKTLVANDGSPGGAKAPAGALELARRLGFGLTMIRVEEPPRLPVGVDEIAEAQADPANLLDKVVASAATRAQVLSVAFESHVAAGRPVSSIVEFIQRGGYDPLVAGYAGYSATFSRIVGGTTHRRVELAPCKALAVK